MLSTKPVSGHDSKKKISGPHTLVLTNLSIAHRVYKINNYKKHTNKGWDGRVGLRRQIKVLVRKGVGSNPTLNKTFCFFGFSVSTFESSLLLTQNKWQKLNINGRSRWDSNPQSPAPEASALSIRPRDLMMSNAILLLLSFAIPVFYIFLLTNFNIPCNNYMPLEM